MMERDHRWEDVYASKKPYNHGHDQELDQNLKTEDCYLCRCVVYRIDVYYKEGHYLWWQLVDEDDLKDLAFPEVDKWFWEEMIGLVDREMRGVE